MSSQMVMYDEEFRHIETVCERLARDSVARAVFLIDKNGQLIVAAGQSANFDTTSLASLVAGEIAATGGLAQLMGEREFSTLFHEGDRDNLHISVVASRAILVVIFDKRTSLGLVRLRVKKGAEELETIFQALVERTAKEGAQTPFAELTDEDIDNLFSV
ncbi:MAG: roadblock/LC7 domain-containing protein [Deltaproteobacteria bacterium]|nr:roadblock/LC7 domain-containing protein [Deltaproteobacteria bacterium]